jgi:nitronate monooxygenase
VRGTEHLAELLPATLYAVQVPVVAAGGVATAERFVELMRLGADAVRVGTRFVVCTESRRIRSMSTRSLPLAARKTPW